jgi:hypothetical protein
VRAASASHIAGMPKPYDVIVVGARCAGSPTAMLLARNGQRAPGRQGHVPERHPVHPPHPCPGHGRAGTVGTAETARRDRLSSRHPLLVRLRAVHDRRDAPPERHRARGLRTAADRHRHPARRGRGQRRRRGPPGIRRGRSGPREWGRCGAARPGTGRQDGDRAGEGGHRRRRPALDGRQGGRAPPVQRATAALFRVLRLLERGARGGLRGVHQGAPGIRRLADPRRPHACRCRVAGGRIQGQSPRHRGHLPEGARPRAGVRSASPGGRKRASGAPAICGASSAPRTAPDGAWSATPGTTSTRSPRWA